MPRGRGPHQDRFWQLEAIRRVALIAGTAPDVHALLDGISAAAADAFGAQGYTLFLIDRQRARLVPMVDHGSTEEERALFAAIPMESTMAARVARDGVARSCLCDDYDAPARESVLKTRYRSVASVPVKARGQVLGCLNLGFLEAKTIDPDGLSLLELMAAHFGNALEARQLQEERRALNQEDALWLDLRANAAELARLQSDLSVKAQLVALGEMSALVAHELRNPISVVGNVLALLEQPQSPQRHAEFVQLARAELKRVDALVQDLLDYARPHALTLTECPIDLLIDDVIRSTEADATARGIVVVSVCQPDLPVLRLDARRIRQALLNLTTNAIEAMPSPGTVHIRAHTADGHLRVEVQDEGTGIAPELQPHLFQPFATTKANGTGLGLVVVQRVVNQHGGTVRVGPADGRGASFVIDLPLSPAAREILQSQRSAS